MQCASVPTYGTYHYIEERLRGMSWMTVAGAPGLRSATAEAASPGRYVYDTPYF